MISEDAELRVSKQTDKLIELLQRVGCEFFSRGVDAGIDVTMNYLRTGVKEGVIALDRNDILTFIEEQLDSMLLESQEVDNEHGF